MQQTEHKSFKAPEETREFPNGRAEILQIGGGEVGRLTFAPGWRWSNDVQPIAGTDSCQTRHTGICIAGQMTIRAADGSEVTIGPGDVCVIEPGHDAWTVGDQACVLYDTGIAAYAKPV
jgi:hypothetical protein